MDKLAEALKESNKIMEEVIETMEAIIKDLGKVEPKLEGDNKNED